MTGTITGIASMATRGILADLTRAYEKRTGQPVAIRSIGGVEAARLVRAGEATDLVILASGVMEALEAEGLLVPGTRVDFARSGIAVAVPAGTPHPDLHDEAAVRDAMRSARCICYSTGPSGDHLKRLWERWGIADAMSQIAVQAPPGVPVAEILARGDADLGFQQRSELLDVPGVDVVGPLPPDIQATTVFVTGIARTSAQIERARALGAFLTSPDADETKRRYGMDPA